MLLDSKNEIHKQFLMPNNISNNVEHPVHCDPAEVSVYL